MTGLWAHGRLPRPRRSVAATRCLDQDPSCARTGDGDFPTFSKAQRKNEDMVVEVHERPKKRTLGRLGAVIVAGLIGAAIVYFVFTGGGGKPGMGAIRAYYQSAAGGEMPESVVKRLEFRGCHETGVITHDGFPVQACDLRDGNRTYSPCFVFDVDGTEVIEAGQDLDCGTLAYDRTTDRFMYR